MISRCIAPPLEVVQQERIGGVCPREKFEIRVQNPAFWALWAVVGRKKWSGQSWTGRTGCYTSVSDTRSMVTGFLLHGEGSVLLYLQSIETFRVHLSLFTEVHCIAVRVASGSLLSCSLPSSSSSSLSS